ncbi:MAG: tRNA glutamyl-Q(34) synthetase GluQRS [Candidatus Devosia phytovorans]|uniref:tRNA glutamyl-Q(34) synthetase GluQRS n=1 Tax=Candidatus Devosia phytovorans TaxID=3121372 RepID=A0AAJ6B097_9HYPH|nr:tRNA glutamyl-Q(34) synthetase GluQRS [Devosia sp.]WEK04491.1 MAG: tRNA glutamyl-Q(34) synthetase GluQRS [Devosia sp.]
MSEKTSKPLLRFAPSPNGLLHLGHAWSALYTWNAAHLLSGTALLRIEDIDTERSKPEFVAAISSDLHWLGLDCPEPVMVQSERMDVYAAAGNHLRDLGLLYPCFCSRSELAVHATGTDPDGAPLYPGTCRHMDRGEQIERLERGDPVQFRLDVDKAMGKVGMLTYSVVGPLVTDRPQIRHAKPERWGDVVLQRKGMPTSYHLSVVADDAAQGITHVTRGRDMEAATDIHVLLQMLLGLPSPIYNFHRLILDDSGKKLAKSRNSKSLADLRNRGWTPEDVRRAVGL